jgi:DNA repair photolyase
MGLNKQKGNMYGFVTHTWNAIKGRCHHWCKYCYMHNLWKSEVHLDKKEFKTNLGENNFIFVGSSTDMFADNIPEGWIIPVLKHCRNYKNRYLFQTKNPKGFIEFFKWFPKDSIFAITLESNRESNFSDAPFIKERVSEFNRISINFPKMITIEPIMDFDLDKFLKILTSCSPSVINIGADSKGHNLPEPSREKIGELIKELEKFTKVNLKDNLKRLYAPHQQEVKE